MKLITSQNHCICLRTYLKYIITVIIIKQFKYHINCWNNHRNHSVHSKYTDVQSYRRRVTVRVQMVRVNVRVSFSSGTLNSCTLNSAPLNSGTLNSGTLNSAPLNSGTLNSGTLNSAPLNSGTLNSSTLNSCTLNSGTLNSNTLNMPL